MQPADANNRNRNTKGTYFLCDARRQYVLPPKKKQANKQTNKRTNERTNEQTNKHTQRNCSKGAAVTDDGVELEEHAEVLSESDGGEGESDSAGGGAGRPEGLRRGEAGS